MKLLGRTDGQNGITIEQWHADESHTMYLVVLRKDGAEVMVAPNHWVSPSDGRIDLNALAIIPCHVWDTVVDHMHAQALEQAGQDLVMVAASLRGVREEY